MDRRTAALMIETKKPTPAEARRAWSDWSLARQRRFADRVEAAFDRGAEPVLAHDEGFPEAWRRLRAGPVGAWRLGRWLEHEPRVGIVGARAAPPSVRRRVAAEAAALAAAGVRVVSGGAVGVDTAAHRGVGASGSVCVVPFGIDEARVGQGQLAVSELVGAAGCVWSAALLRHRARGRFVARNRLLAALCERIIIAWAAPASGSMHTARFAHALGIPIAAWWDAADPPGNDGCRSLQRGASLSAEQRGLLLQLEAAGGAVAGLPGGDSPARQICLFELECAGHIERLAAGVFRLR